MRKLYAASMPGGAKTIVNFFAQADPHPKGEYNSIAFWQSIGYEVFEVSTTIVPNADVREES